MHKEEESEFEFFKIFYIWKMIMNLNYFVEQKPTTADTKEFLSKILFKKSLDMNRITNLAKPKHQLCREILIISNIYST